MGRSKIQFQKGLSLLQFKHKYCNEEQCEASRHYCTLNQLSSLYLASSSFSATFFFRGDILSMEISRLSRLIPVYFLNIFII